MIIKTIHSVAVLQHETTELGSISSVPDQAICKYVLNLIVVLPLRLQLPLDEVHGVFLLVVGEQESMPVPQSS